MQLILITGLPGAGKTTFARELAKRLNIKHLNTDMVRDALGKRGQYDAATKASIYQALFQETESELCANRDVIVDGTFYQRSLREDFEDLAEQCHAQVYWIEIKASEQIIKQRVSQKRAYSEADFAVYLKIKSEYEPIQTPHLVIESDAIDLETMTNRAMQYLNEHL